jgi:hypothetical protein
VPAVTDDFYRIRLLGNEWPDVRCGKGGVMDEAEARARCAELAESSPDRSTHSWVAKQLPEGEWTVVKLAVPAPKSPDSVKTVSAKEQAAQHDPRTAFEQNVPPYGVGM